MSDFRACLIMLILIRGMICYKISCDYDLQTQEKGILNNLDKLLNQSYVKVANGVILRRRSEFPGTQHTTTVRCVNARNNVFQHFIEKLGHIVQTHVLELDFDSMITKG